MLLPGERGSSVTKSPLLCEESFQGPQQPARSQSVGELNAVVDGPRSQNEEFADGMVQFLDTVNDFSVLLNNNNSSTVSVQH